MATQTAIKKTEGEIARAEQTRDRWTYAPNVDIIERDDELMVVADVPGATAEHVDIQYERDLLSIYARVEPRQAPTTEYLLREYGVGDYDRSFRIGEGIDAEKIQARLSQGVLELYLPKSEAFRRKKITVQGA